MATLQVYPPSETTRFSGPFSPASNAQTYSASSAHSPSTSPKYTAANTGHLNLPPATDALIGLEAQPSFTARLHRRKKSFKPPTAPPENASHPHDPLRAARLAWRLQEEYAEQARLEQESMRQSSSSFQRQQREFTSQVRQTAPIQSKRKQKKVKGSWHAFLLWFKLGFYRFTRNVKSCFTG
jgi:hypothetical protein